MPGRKHLTRLVQAIEGSVEHLNNSLPGIERRILNEVELLLRDLDLVNGNVRASVKNLRTISRIKTKLERIVVRDSGYRRGVDTYLGAFDKINAIQQDYFRTVEQGFEPSTFLKALENQSLEDTALSLTRGGIASNVVDPIRGVLQAGVRDQLSYSQLITSLRETITGSPDKLGGLERYVKQLTTDGLNQYAAQYMEVVSSDLGLDWYQYTGVKIETSRDFCIAMVNKRFFHRLEIPDLLKGQFPQFRAIGGSLNPKTGLPDGMNPATTSENFLVYRGGYNCHHQPIPVTETIVPSSERKRVYDKFGVPYNAEVFEIAA